MPLPAHLSPTPAALTDEALDEALELAMDPEHPEAMSEEVVRWTIGDDGAAEWAMRKYRDAEAAGYRIAGQAAEWRAQIDEWADEEMRRNRVMARLAFFAHHLEDYALRRREADPNAKTLNLPSGKVKTTRPTAGKIEVSDKAEFVDWAVAEGFYDLLRHEPNISAVRGETKINPVSVGDDNAVRVVFVTDDDSIEVVPGLTWVAPETTARVAPPDA